MQNWIFLIEMPPDKPRHWDRLNFALVDRISGLPSLKEVPMKAMLLSVTEACHVLGIGRTKIYQLISRRVIDTIKIGARRLVIKRSLMNFVESSREGMYDNILTATEEFFPVDVCNSHSSPDSVGKVSTETLEISDINPSHANGYAGSFGGAGDE